MTGASAISGYRSRRGKGERLPPSILQHRQERDRESDVMWWEAGGLVSNQSCGGICKSHRPGTVSSLPAHPGDGRHTNLLRPQGTKIHTIIYFTFMSSCVMKIKSKTKPGGPWSYFTFLLPSFSHLFFSFSLAAFLWSVNQILLMYESEVPTVHRRPLYSARACRVQPHLNASFPTNL